MLTRSKPTWEMPESEATPEADFLNRRELCKTIAAGSILAHQDWKRQKCGSGLAIATAYGAVQACARMLD